MVKVLTAAEIDPLDEEVDLTMTRAEEDAAASIRGWRPTDTAPDLSDGGTLNGATVYPTHQGVRQDTGRAVAREAFMWDGTKSLLPLAWNPDGNSHDGARPYLLKRHCLCCGTSGFRGRCPACSKNNCTTCHSGLDRAKTIPNFYLRAEDVPFPARFHGDIDCFLPFCLRRGEKGFKTEEDMRLHARTRHRMEYQAYMESQESAKKSELQSLRERLDRLQARPVPISGPATNALDDLEYKAYLKKRKAAKARRAKASVVTNDHPLERA